MNRYKPNIKEILMKITYEVENNNFEKPTAPDCQKSMFLTFCAPSASSGHSILRTILLFGTSFPDFIGICGKVWSFSRFRSKQIKNVTKSR